MKFLVDANLPPELCVWLRVRGHDAEHVSEVHLLTATDTQLWQLGRSQALIIFTKDVDFYDRALLYSAPPQIVHLAVGNCSNSRLFELLASKWTEIEASLLAGSKLISMTQEKFEVFP